MDCISDKASNLRSAQAIGQKSGKRGRGVNLRQTLEINHGESGRNKWLYTNNSYWKSSLRKIECTIVGNVPRGKSDLKNGGPVHVVLATGMCDSGGLRSKNDELRKWIPDASWSPDRLYSWSMMRVFASPEGEKLCAPEVASTGHSRYNDPQPLSGHCKNCVYGA